MPVVTCPKCPTKLRVADGATGKVKCPKCATIFAPAAAPAPAPAFEVVDEAPAKPAAAALAKPGTGTAPAAKAPTKADADGDDFDFDTKPKKKKADDDDDDRPKKKRRDDDEDDDDDRPRGKKRRDDDDDDDDRPRKKKKRRRDDDEDEDDGWRPPARGNPYGKARTGAQLMMIGLWLYTGMFGLLALFMLIGLAANIPDGLVAIPGLCGVGCTILTIIGVSFCIAGPSKAKGMAIATVSVAAAHLVLVVICYDKISGSRGGMGIGLMGGMDWLFLGTSIWVLDVILPALIYLPKGAGLGGEGFLFVLAGGCELARMIMVCLTLKALATAGKDYDTAEKAGKGVIVTSIVCGGAAIAVLLFIVIVDAAKSMSLIRYGGPLFGTAVCAAYALMAATGAMAATDTKDTMARRARRG